MCVQRKDGTNVWLTNDRPTIEKLRRDIASMREEIEARQAERVALGLPPNRPDDFVETQHAAEMVKRVHPVYEALVKYLRVLDESKKPVPFPVERFDKYREILKLIAWSDDSILGHYGSALRLSIDLISDMDGGYDRTVTGLHRYLKFAQNCRTFSEQVDAFEGTDEELDAIIAEYQRHYEEVVEPQVTYEKAVLESAGKGQTNE